jgi:RNA polymerase sigma-70 factor (ECF subfamily)
MDSARNTDEFVRLFSLWAKPVYSYIHILVPHHSDAEDLFQETSRTLWAKFDQYQPGPDDNFRTWAIRIARFKVMHYRRLRGRNRVRFVDQLDESLSEAASTMAGSLNAQFEALDDCYAKLSAEDQQLIDARYQIGATVEAIAAQLGQSVHSVYRSLRRIHQWLFDCIRRDETGQNQAANPERGRLP